MKILVTGATGFLGKYVIDELLAHDYTIVAETKKMGKLWKMIASNLSKGI